MLAFACVVGIVSLFPSYIQARVARQSISNKNVQASSTEDARYTLLRRELSQSASQVTLLAQSTQGPTASTLIEGVIRLRDTVKITSLSVSRDGVSPTKLVVRGNAPTRDTLLAFRDRLEAQPQIDHVDLPVSQLTKSASIQFSLEIIYKSL